MSVGNPEVLSVSPQPEATSVVLKPIIQIAFTGPSLIDTLTWNSGTFALYGPGDVCYEAGPGTILNSGIISDPYTLIDGAVIRERIEGTYYLYTSGMPRESGVQIDSLGVSGTVVLAEFVPNEPLNAYTQYTAVLVGEDAIAWSTTQNIFPGVTSWISASGFSGPTESGVLLVRTPYTRTLPSIIWDSTSGYNDTFRVFITSGSDMGTPGFDWQRDYSPGRFTGTPGSGIQNLGDGLGFQFQGAFTSGQEYTLDVYIPKPLQKSYIWSFSTATISGSTPPADVNTPDLIIDMTPDGGMAPVSETDVPLQLVATWPENLAYGVRPDLPLIMLEFNKPLVSGSLDITKIQIRCTALLSMPNTSGTGLVSPQIIEYSGVYLKLWL